MSVALFDVIVGCYHNNGMFIIKSLIIMRWEWWLTYQHFQAVSYLIWLYLSCLDSIQVPQQLCQVSWGRTHIFWSCDHVAPPVLTLNLVFHCTMGIDRLYSNLEHNQIEDPTAWQCWYISHNSCCSCSKIAHVAVLLLPSWQDHREFGAYKAVLLSLFTYLTTYPQSLICSRAMESMI